MTKEEQKTDYLRISLGELNAEIAGDEAGMEAMKKGLREILL